MNELWCPECMEWREDMSSFFGTPSCEECGSELEEKVSPTLVEVDYKDVDSFINHDEVGGDTDYDEEETEDMRLRKSTPTITNLKVKPKAKQNKSIGPLNAALIYSMDRHTTARKRFVTERTLVCDSVRLAGDAHRAEAEGRAQRRNVVPEMVLRPERAKALVFLAILFGTP